MKRRFIIAALLLCAVGNTNIYAHDERTVDMQGAEQEEAVVQAESSVEATDTLLLQMTDELDKQINEVPKDEDPLLRVAAALGVLETVTAAKDVDAEVRNQLIVHVHGRVKELVREEFLEAIKVMQTHVLEESRGISANEMNDLQQRFAALLMTWRVLGGSEMPTRGIDQNGVVNTTLELLVHRANRDEIPEHTTDMPSAIGTPSQQQSSSNPEMAQINLAQIKQLQAALVKASLKTDEKVKENEKLTGQRNALAALTAVFGTVTIGLIIYHVYQSFANKNKFFIGVNKDLSADDQVELALTHKDMKVLTEYGMNITENVTKPLPDFLGAVKQNGDASRGIVSEKRRHGLAAVREVAIARVAHRRAERAKVGAVVAQLEGLGENVRSLDSGTFKAIRTQKEWRALSKDARRELEPFFARYNPSKDGVVYNKAKDLELAGEIRQYGFVPVRPVDQPKAKIVWMHISMYSDRADEFVDCSVEVDGTPVPEPEVESGDEAAAPVSGWAAIRARAQAGVRRAQEAAARLRRSRSQEQEEEGKEDGSDSEQEGSGDDAAAPLLHPSPRLNRGASHGSGLGETGRASRQSARRRGRRASASEVATPVVTAPPLRRAATEAVHVAAPAEEMQDQTSGEESDDAELEHSVGSLVEEHGEESGQEDLFAGAERSRTPDTDPFSGLNDTQGD